MFKSKKNQISAVLSLTLISFVGLTFSSSTSAVPTPQAEASDLFKNFAPIQKWGEKSWNLVHSLGQESLQAIALAQYLAQRRALNTSSESETVLLLPSMAGYKTSLQKAGYDVFSIDAELATQSLSEPVLMIFDQNRSVQYSGPYGSADFIKSNFDLLQLVQLKNRKNADLLPVLGGFVQLKDRALANLLQTSYSQYKFD